jgi:hypothetical protein
MNEQLKIKGKQISVNKKLRLYWQIVKNMEDLKR